MERESRRFAASLDALPKMMEMVQKALRQSGLPEDRCQQVEVALEEALVNIIHYAYPRKTGPRKTGPHKTAPHKTAKAEIELSWQKLPAGLTFTLTDWGVPFDPASKCHPIDERKSVEERAIGGLGIALIYRLMDQVTYQRLEAANQLQLTKF